LADGWSSVPSSLVVSPWSVPLPLVLPGRISPLLVPHRGVSPVLILRRGIAFFFVLTAAFLLLLVLFAFGLVLLLGICGALMGFLVANVLGVELVQAELDSDGSFPLHSLALAAVDSDFCGVGDVDQLELWELFGHEAGH
jgi:hypothetical protein